MFELSQLGIGLVIFLTGILTAFINSIAGGGSTLSLSLFLLLGMPVATAHGTNRFGLLFGAFGSLFTLKDAGYVKPKDNIKISIPIIIGTISGTLITISLPEAYLNFALALVFLWISFSSSFTKLSAQNLESPSYSNWVKILVLFLLGLYGGFIQVGNGLIMMYVFGRFLKMPIYNLNALKAFLAVVILLVSVLIFIPTGYIHWAPAFYFALGSYLGGKLGANWQLKKGVGWITWLVRIMGVAMSLKLIVSLFGSF